MAKVAPKVAVEKEATTTVVSIDRFAEARNAVDPETAGAIGNPRARKRGA